MNTIYATELTVGKTIQVGRIRGKVATLVLSKGKRGSWGFVVVTLKNERVLILGGSKLVKVSA